ncbi:sensor histidine kinase [Candidatus Raskinella chloraquaticus]|uniref:histidine kinase n=1 Tax=Candidatus Raskinella chloraquaticus TaxID=1951219 RepID=A0A1W9HQW2_9HYPH|nr:MAG: hypothetical protein A4S15_02605 [Proteobacteria bacterium SG_bin8]
MAQSVASLSGRWRSDPLFGVLASFALFAAALASRVALDGVLPDGFPYITFFPAVVLSTFFMGTRAGIFCAVLSGLASWYFFLPPHWSFATDSTTMLALIFYLVVVGVDILVIDRMVAAQTELAGARNEAIAALSQRDALFVELQHRIGNNLNAVSALLNLQARAIGDTNAHRALVEAAQRIGTIASINRLFLEPSRSGGQLDAQFVRDLASRCVEVGGQGQAVDIDVAGDTILLSQDEFLPTGLVIAECINNALEHGFPDSRSGRLTVRLRADAANGSAEISVRDDGVGLPAHFSLDEAESVGLQLIKLFAMQLNGTFTMSAALPQGTLSTLRFRPTGAAEFDNEPASFLTFS